MEDDDKEAGRVKRENPLQAMKNEQPEIEDILLNLDNEDFENVKVKLEPKKGYYDYDHNSFLSGKILNNFFPVSQFLL